MLFSIVEQIALDLKPKIPGLGLIAGLVTTTLLESDKKVKRLPRAANLSDDECNAREQVLVLPDGKNTAMIFFVEGTTVFEEVKADKCARVKSEVDLVCWWNTKRLDTTRDNFIATMIKSMPATITPLQNAKMIQIRYRGQSSENVFDKWTLEEERNQFLMLPYDFFVLKYDVSYLSTWDCVTDINEIAPC